MRLHFIAASIFATVLACGCSGNADRHSEVTEAQPRGRAERKNVNPLVNVLPDEDIQKKLFKQAEKGVAEDKADIDHAKQEEQNLKARAARAAAANDFDTEAAIALELAELYAHNRRIRDALVQFGTAGQLGRRMKDNNGMRAHALAMQGEMNMRLFKYEDAIENFDQAKKLVREPNKYLENSTKMELRMVWALHGAGRDADAKRLLAKAKKEALKQGKRCAAYHVALAVEGALAVERTDSETANRMSQEFEALPEPTSADAEFGRSYLKACAKSTRHEGFMDAEDYLDDKESYFRDIIKQISRQGRRRRTGSTS